MLMSDVSEAATYYVALTGHDGHSCAQAQEPATPKQTFQSALACLQAGDTLLVKAGTYTESIMSPRGGTSWHQPVTIAAAPGEQVILRATPGANWVFHFADAASSYIILRGLVIDASEASLDAIKITWSTAGGQSNYIRIQQTEIFGSPGQGIIAHGTGLEFLNLNVHHNGRSRYDHGIYLTGTKNLIADSHYHHNAGYGIHVYNTPGGVEDNVVCGNRVWANGTEQPYTAGILLASGARNIAYNNVVWGNTVGIQVAHGATEAHVYNNTIYGNTGEGIFIFENALHTMVRNNIVYSNRDTIANRGSGTMLSHNFTADPHFVNAAEQDFALAPGSPARAMGTPIGAVTTESPGRGTPHLQGKGCDLGAYEYGDRALPSPAATAPKNLRAVAR